MIESVLIANRGEIAVRIIRACRLNNIKTVAVFSEIDADSLHVKMADSSYTLGNGPASETYLNIPKMMDIIKRADVSAVHPGYGFLSENSEFAKKVTEAGKIFIGPSSEVIDFLGDKVKARQIAKKVGIPIVPGSEGYVTTYEEAKVVATEIGFPLIIKASFGGGGKGMEIVKSEEALEISLLGCQSMAQSYFGRPEVFIEKYISAPRHIEIQFIGDSKGNVIYLGERECSIQRSHQKILEEAPSFLPREQIAELGEKVCSLAKELGYANAGTAEFLWKDGEIYFNEVNPRIQVEHPVTEMITGIDLVSEQLNVAANKKLSFKQKDVKLRGHAIEFRINAEDPFQAFLPQSGEIEQLIVPGGTNVRFDTFLYHSFNVPNCFDSLVGKLIVWGETREKAINTARIALKEFTISGIRTNIELHQAILETPEYQTNNLTTDFLDRSQVKKILSDYEVCKLVAIMAAKEIQRHAFIKERQEEIMVVDKKKWRVHTRNEFLRSFP